MGHWASSSPGREESQSTHGRGNKQLTASLPLFPAGLLHSYIPSNSSLTVLRASLRAFLTPSKGLGNKRPGSLKEIPEIGS